MARAFDDQLDTCEPIEPKFAGSAKVPEALTEFSDAGMGRMLKLKTGMTLEEAVRRVKALLGLKHGEVPATKWVALAIGSDTTSVAYSASRKAIHPEADRDYRRLRWLWEWTFQGRRGGSLFYR